MTIVAGVLAEGCGATPSGWSEDIGDGCARMHNADDAVTLVACTTNAGCEQYTSPDGSFVEMACPADAGCRLATYPGGDASLQCAPVGHDQLC